MQVFEMRTLLFVAISFLFVSTIQAGCFLGRFGKDCPRHQHNADGNQTIIYNGAIGGPPYARGGGSDGGALRKRNAGDKSKNQGYAEYKEHFLYYAYEVYSAPHQEGFYKSADTANRSIAYEYAFNPFISFKAQRSELFYEGLSGGSSMKQEHLMALLNLRIYVLNDFVVRAGMGMGKSKINAEGAEDNRYNFTEEGSTEVVQFSANYIFGDENTFLGISTTTVQGISGENNLGASFYGLNAGIGF